MHHERWARLEQLFSQGRALPERERAAWLARACGSDAELRRDVEELLRSDALPGVLDRPPLAADGAEPAAVAPSLAAGTRVGVWRIEELVGRGGMGEVFAATRVEAEFEQRGALKLLRFEAIGELARFNAERQILARLDHPGIARLLDGGVARDGRPYTVMEFVEGTSLIDYCNARGATLHERLDLFAQVCDAVAYAHRNLVIHRDLKPANTLVDADGKVKLLDFGIAKLIDAGASAAAADPTLTFAPFTPDYAAPEQLAGEPVTTATDVYSLGILLFELLTGERPQRTRGLPSAQALAVLDREAPLPSRVASGKPSAPVPARALAGDLDAVVAKCLRRESAHRYDTANALKLDLLRHLAHEPVLAREGARLYVFGRMLRRYRWGAAAAAALVVALAAGLAGTLWQARRAETQARTAKAVQGFVTDLFHANSSDQKDPVKARATTARELLDLGAKKIDTQMRDAPAAKLGVLNLFGDLYADLELRSDQIPLRREAVELTRELYGPDSPELAAALGALAGAMYGTEVANEREPLLREALAILDRNGDRDSEIRGRLLLRFYELYDGRFETLPKALDYARQSVQVLEQHPPSVDLAEAWYTQGLAETYNFLPEQAIVSLNHAIEISGAVQGVPNPKLIVMYYELADTQIDLQDFAAAERSARLGLQMALQVNGEDHVDAVRAHMMLGIALLSGGHSAEGLEHLGRAKRDVLRLLGPDDPFHTRAVIETNGSWQVDVGDIAEGVDDMRAVIANRVRVPDSPLNLTPAMRKIAKGLIDLGRYEEAGKTIDEAAAIYDTNDQWKSGTPRYNGVKLLRAQLAMAESRPDTARKLLAELVFDGDQEKVSRADAALAASQRTTQWLMEAEIAVETDNDANDVQASLAGARSEMESRQFVKDRKLHASDADLIEGESRMKRREFTAALPLLQRALSAREVLFVAPHPRLAEAQILMATCYFELGRMEESRELAAKAAAIEAHYPRLGDRYRRPLHELEAMLHSATKSSAPRAGHGGAGEPRLPGSLVEK